MYDADRIQDRELTTEQIAGAGTAPARQDGPADPGQQARLLEDAELQGITARWKDIQAA
jgi:hypothetical protein